MNKQLISIGKRLDGQARRSSRWRLALALACLVLLILALGIVPSRARDGGAGTYVAPQGGSGRAFTYQGRLTDGGNPANGQYDFEFGLFDVSSGGVPIGIMTINDKQVTDGLFTVELSFSSNVLKGELRYLEIGVRPGNSTGTYTTLTPRQALTPAPYALALPGLWIRPHGTSPNIIGGHIDNAVATDIYGAVIGGGGNSSSPNQVLGNYGTVGGGYGNIATGTQATVGGGGLNTASGWQSTIGGGFDNETNAYYATVSGGLHNIASQDYAAIGGGFDNTASGNRATIGGGQYNTADGEYATVDGGDSNTASGHADTVGGGEDNTASGYADTIAGGGNNSTAGSGGYATIGGGYHNTATGYAATVPGGSYNEAAGFYSFAVGYRAKANHAGSIILSDSNPFDFGSAGTNNFRVRATNGIRFVVGINGTSGATTWSCALVDGSAWSCSSDRNQKENLVPVDGADVLRQLEEMPIYTWNGKGQDTEVRHMGPTAQDFYAAYGLGEGDTHISTIDLDGVALAAVQELHARNQALQKQVDDLEARLAALEQGTVSPSPATGVPPWSLLGGLLVAAVAVVVLRKGGRR